MRALVTGGTGFIGSHLVRVLLGHDAEVCVLLRATSDASILEAFPVQCVRGDLTDLSSLRQAMRGVDVVFHLAADNRMAVARPRRMRQTNVDGALAVLRVATDAGVSRIVFTSSAVTVKCSGETSGTEKDFVDPGDCRSTYQLTKVLAEQAVRAMIEDGAPITIVNPSTAVGPRDRRPTPAGRLIVDFLNGRLPTYLDAMMNWVHVEDVARGHLLAATRGSIGERYILGHETLSLGEFLRILGEISGRRPPRMKIPYAVAYLAGMFGTAWTRVSSREPQATLDGVRMAATPMHYDSTKAVGELGLPQTPIRIGLEQAVQWFRSDEFTSKGGSR